MKRRAFIAALGSAAVLPVAGRAQHSSGPRRVGILMHGVQTDQLWQQRLAAFRQELEGLGWLENRNVKFEARYSANDYDRLRPLAHELVALNPNVIFTSTTPAIKALQQETRTIPLIFVEVSDPTGAGVVASLARPGGNTTGLLFYEDSILGKWLQFILGNIGTHAYNQTLYKKPLYDARNDFAPVGLIGFGFYVLVVRNDLPVNSLSEFIAYAKANQSKMQYGSGGAGSATHISCVLLNQAIGTNITHIPYRGAGPALQELMGGRLDFMCDAIQTSLPHIQAGTVKAIATLSEQRTPLLPDLPTVQQQGLTEFAVYEWSAAFFPKGIDQAMVRRLNAAIGEVLDTQSVRERFEALGYKLAAPEQRSPDYLAKFVASEIEKWAGPIKLSGVSMD